MPLLFSLALLPLTGCASPADDSAALSLDEAFQVSAKEYDVPRDLLVAIAYGMTRFDDPMEGDHEHGGMRGYGVMDMAAGSPAFGPDIDRAAARLGIEREIAVHDRAWNIAAAASELRWKADQIEEEEGVTIERIDDWAGVVGWYSGSDDGGAQRSYARQVYRWIEGGLRAEDPMEGGVLTIEPRELDLPMLYMEMVSSSGADSGLATNYVRAASCNYTSGRSTSDIDMIVVHTAQGSYSGTYNWFQNCSASASAHYVLRSSDGEITQMVAEKDDAWHAGHSVTNNRSVSIELEGYIEDPTRWYTAASMQSLANLVTDIASRQGVALDRSHVIGHMEVPGCKYAGGGGASCHTDPGTGFDWTQLFSLFGSGSSSSSSSSSTSPAPTSGTGNLVGYVRKDSIYNTGGSVSGASVAVSTGQTGTTNSSGYFSISAVPAGGVTVTVTASGYKTATDGADVDAGITNWNSVAVVAGSSSSSSSSSSTPPTTPTAPGNNAPSGWQTVTSEGVTLSWTSTGATSYEVKIYWYDGSDWNDYYGYTTKTASKTFWPAVHDTDYAWVVRSVGSTGTSEWSPMNYFTYAN